MKLGLSALIIIAIIIIILSILSSGIQVESYIFYASIREKHLLKLFGVKLVLKYSRNNSFEKSQK